MLPACPAPCEPSRPQAPLPRKACDTHAHVFGPVARFPYAADRSYTPPDAPLAKYLGMLDRLGFACAALASEASGQRGHSIRRARASPLDVRAHSASEDARERAGDTSP
jgi:hypothetical protein